MTEDNWDNDYDSSRDVRGKAEAYWVGKINCVLLSGTATAAPMAKSQSHVN